MGLSSREQTAFRLERLTALLQQATEALIGCGQYIPDNDENRAILTEIVKTNNVVLEQEQEALRVDEMERNTQIITLN